MASFPSPQRPADRRTSGALSPMERPAPLGRPGRQRHRGPGQPRRLPRLADARDRFHREPDQRRRRIGAPGRSRRVAMERARLLANARPDEQLRQRQRRAHQASRVSLQYSVPSRGLGGSLEVRPPMPEGFELRLGADARRTWRIARAFILRRRRANPSPCRGRRELDGGAFAEAAPSWTRDVDRRRADRSLEHQRRASVRADDRHRRGDCGRARSVAQRLAADCARRRRGPGRRRTEPALRSLSRLADADAQRAVPAVSRGRRRDRGQSRPRSRAARGSGSGIDYLERALQRCRSPASSTG